MNSDRPVILLGRGGSGTRMMSDIARSLGVFLGNQVNATGDSVEWVGPLYELAVESLTAEMPGLRGRDLYWRQRLQALAADVLAAAGHRSTGPWGWKLPETMLVLATVLQAFPAARVIHLVRHPVTSSLRRTHITSRMDNAVGQAVLTAAYRSCGLDPQHISEDEIYVHNATTWAFQIASVLDVLQRLSPRVLQIYYEDMCRDPRGTQAAIGGFLGLEVQGAAMLPEVDMARANESGKFDPRARHVWSICGNIAEILGYDVYGLPRQQARPV